MKTKMTDEEKARELINALSSLEGKQALLVDFQEDFIIVTVFEQFKQGKKVVSQKVDMSKLSKTTNDELSYAVLHALELVF